MRPTCWSKRAKDQLIHLVGAPFATAPLERFWTAESQVVIKPAAHPSSRREARETTRN